MDISETLTKFILDNFSGNLNKQTLNADEDLLEQGIIDSLGVMGLISFMEEQFGIIVNDEEVVPENFQSVNAIQSYLQQKISAQRADTP